MAGGAGVTAGPPPPPRGDVRRGEGHHGLHHHDLAHHDADEPDDADQHYGIEQHPGVHHVVGGQLHDSGLEHGPGQHHGLPHYGVGHHVRALSVRARQLMGGLVSAPFGNAVDDLCGPCVLADALALGRPGLLLSCLGCLAVCGVVGRQRRLWRASARCRRRPAAPEAAAAAPAADGGAPPAQFELARGETTHGVRALPEVPEEAPGHPEVLGVTRPAGSPRGTRSASDVESEEMQRATRRIIELLQQFNNVKGENFDEMKKELLTTLKRDLPKTGQMFSMLKDEATRILAWQNLPYTVVKTTVLTTGLHVSQSRQIRRVEVGEVMEVTQGPTMDPSIGIYRILGRALMDGVTGWATIAGNQGATFLMPGLSLFKVKKEIVLSEDLRDMEGAKPVKTLEEGQMLEMIEWGRTSRSMLGITRIRARAEDGSIGWATMSDNEGNVNLEPT